MPISLPPIGKLLPCKISFYLIRKFHLECNEGNAACHPIGKRRQKKHKRSDKCSENCHCQSQSDCFQHIFAYADCITNRAVVTDTVVVCVFNDKERGKQDDKNNHHSQQCGYKAFLLRHFSHSLLKRFGKLRRFQTERLPFCLRQNFYI